MAKPAEDEIQIKISSQTHPIDSDAAVQPPPSDAGTASKIGRTPGSKTDSTIETDNMTAAEAANQAILQGSGGIPSSINVNYDKQSKETIQRLTWQMKKILDANNKLRSQKEEAENEAKEARADSKKKDKLHKAPKPISPNPVRKDQSVSPNERSKKRSRPTKRKPPKKGGRKD